MAILLKRRIIAIIQIVKTHDDKRLLAIEGSQHEVGAYEAGGAGDEEGLGFIGHVIDLVQIFYSPPNFLSTENIPAPAFPVQDSGLGSGVTHTRV